MTLDLVRRAAETFGGMTIDFAMGRAPARTPGAAKARGASAGGTSSGGRRPARAGVTDIDDKIIARATELGLEPLELARREEANFFEDLETLGCAPPTLVLRVSEHVDDVVAFVGDIVEKGYGYTTDEGVWFDVAKLGDAYLFPRRLFL